MGIKQCMINLAKQIYLNTPYKTLRKWYFAMFCALVRNRVVETSVDGINYRLNLGEIIDVGVYLNRYEPGVTRAIEKLCRRGMTVLDIGANMGAHALRFAKVVGESGTVFAFEPTNYAYKKLVDNIAINRFKNISAIKMALSDGRPSRRVMRCVCSWPTRGKSVIEESLVDCIKLDDWCKRERVHHIDLIKLDVDGNEQSVITGGRCLLESEHPMLLLEVWGPNFAEPTSNPYSSLQKLGYNFANVDTGYEYRSISELKREVSCSDGGLLDFSTNVVARFDKGKH